MFTDDTDPEHHDTEDPPFKTKEGERHSDIAYLHDDWADIRDRGKKQFGGKNAERDYADVGIHRAAAEAHQMASDAHEEGHEHAEKLSRIADSFSKVLGIPGKREKPPSVRDSINTAVESGHKANHRASLELKLKSAIKNGDAEAIKEHRADLEALNDEED